MSIEKYDSIFMECFGIGQDQLGPDLEYQSIAEWDSVGHMTMIADIEDAFEVTIDIDDIIAFSSYEEGKKILERYDVQI